MAQQQVRAAALFGFEVGVETILVEAAVAVERALEQLAHGRKASRGGEAEFGDPIAREGVAQREFGAECRLRARGVKSGGVRSEEHTSELQSLMRSSSVVIC